MSVINESSINSEQPDAYEVEKVLDHKATNGTLEYLVRWLNYSPTHDSWVSEEDMQCPETIEDYWTSQYPKTANDVKLKSLKNTPPRRNKNPRRSHIHPLASCSKPNFDEVSDDDFDDEMKSQPKSSRKRLRSSSSLTTINSTPSKRANTRSFTAYKSHEEDETDNYAKNVVDVRPESSSILSQAWQSSDINEMTSAISCFEDVKPTRQNWCTIDEQTVQSTIEQNRPKHEPTEQGVNPAMSQDSEKNVQQHQILLGLDQRECVNQEAEEGGREAKKKEEIKKRNTENMWIRELLEKQEERKNLLERIKGDELRYLVETTKPLFGLGCNASEDCFENMKKLAEREIKENEEKDRKHDIYLNPLKEEEYVRILFPQFDQSIFIDRKPINGSTFPSDIEDFKRKAREVIEFTFPEEHPLTKKISVLILKYRVGMVEFVQKDPPRIYLNRYENEYESLYRTELRKRGLLKDTEVPTIKEFIFDDPPDIPISTCIADEKLLDFIMYNPPDPETSKAKLKIWHWHNFEHSKRNIISLGYKPQTIICVFYHFFPRNNHKLERTEIEAVVQFEGHNVTQIFDIRYLRQRFPKLVDDYVQRQYTARGGDPNKKGREPEEYEPNDEWIQWYGSYWQLQLPLC